MWTRIALLLTLTSFLPLSSLPAQIPGMINYQGRIVSNGANFDGSGQFKFALVNGSGNVSYWSNDGSSASGSEPASAVSLAVVKGLYSVQLGDVSLTHMTALPAAVFTHGEVHLRVWFNDGTSGFQMLVPDKRIAAVGYAMVAENVSDGAITTPKIAPGAVTSAKIAAGSIDSTHLAPGLTLGGTTSGTFSGNVAGNATNFTGLLSGDVTGPQGATVVEMVGGSTAASVHAAEQAVSSATPASTGDTLVKRDAGGNFAAGTITGSVTGSAASFTGVLSGDVAGTQSATSIAASTVTGKPLTGYTSSPGTVNAGDSILSAIGKLNGNVALKAPLDSPAFTGTASGSFSGPLAGNVTGNVSGSAASFTGALSGDVTGTQGATSIAATTVTGKVLTGYTSAAGTVSAADSILAAIGKLNGNDAQKAPLASPTFTGIVTGSFNGPLAGNVTGNVSGSAASFTGSLAGDVTGTQGATSIAATTVTGKVLTGYASATGTVSAADSILAAIGKLNGNDAQQAPLASPIFTGTITLPAGTASAPPLRLQGGTILTTPVFGALEFDGTNLYVTNNSATPARKTVAFTDTPAPPAPTPTWIFADVKSNGSTAGGATASSWERRNLNTTQFSSGTNCILSASTIVLQPGTYTIRTSAPAYNVNRHQIRLYNTTDGAVAAWGTSESASSGQTRSHLVARVQVTSAKIFQIEHYFSNQSSPGGMGTPASAGGSADEIYTIVEITQ